MTDLLKPGFKAFGEGSAPFRPTLRFERKLENASEESSFNDLIAASIDLDWISSSFANRAAIHGVEVDWNFKPTEAEWQNITKDIPPEHHDRLATAFSSEQLLAIHDRIKTELALEQQLGEAGWEGFGARILANVADPQALLVSLAAGPSAWLSKGTRLQRAIKGALSAGGANATIEALIASGQLTRDSSDILYAGLAGMALGAPLGMLGRGEQIQYNRNVENAARRQDQVELDELSDAVGADRVRAYNEPLRDDRETLVKYGDPEYDAERSALGGVRIDVVGKLGQSDDELVRTMGRRLGEEAVGLVNRDARQTIGATERATQINRTLMATFRRVSEMAFRDWTREQGLPWWKSIFSLESRAKFHEEVGRAIRGEVSDNGHVNRAAQRSREVYAEFLKQLKAAGVKGFDDVEFNPNYLPRIFAHDKIRALGSEFGTSELQRLIRVAIQRRTPTLSKDVLDAFSRGYLHKIRRIGANMDQGIVHGIRTDDVEFVREMLTETDMDVNAIEDVLTSLKKTNAGRGKHDRAKQRVDLDETTTLQLQARDGSLRDVNIMDLFENNAEKLMQAYSRQMSGLIGLAREANIKSAGDFNELINTVRSRGLDRGRSLNAVDDDVKRLTFLYDGARGVPLESDPASVFARGARLVRDYNFVRIMNQVGFAQLAEIGNLLSLAGFRNVISHVPGMRAMLTRARNGEIDDDLAMELEHLVGLGTDRLNNQVATRFDEYGYGFGSESLVGQGLQKVDDLLQAGKRITADISGMASINIVLQRMAAKAVSQKITSHLLDGVELSVVEMRRLKSMGLHEDSLRAIKAQLEKHASLEPSRWVKGGKLQRINPEQWDDMDALDAFTMAVHRMGRRIIQENDIGATPMFMHSTTGKLMTQFRSFMITAYTKQTLHNLHHRDFTSWTALTGSMFFGGIAYMVQTSLNYANDEEQLHKRLRVEEIAKAAFQRAGASSFIPMVVDTVADNILGEDPLFAYGRSTGLGSDLLRGLPAVDTLNKLSGVAGLGRAMRDDYEFSQKDYRNLTGLIPFVSNMLGARNVHNALMDNLPHRSQSFEDF